MIHYQRIQDESHLINEKHMSPTDYFDCNDSLYQNALSVLKQKYKELYQ